MGDVRTIDQLLAAGNTVSMIGGRQGVAIGYLEEVAYREGLFDRGGLEALADGVPRRRLRRYLRALLTDSFGTAT